MSISINPPATPALLVAGNTVLDCGSVFGRFEMGIYQDLPLAKRRRLFTAYGLTPEECEANAKLIVEAAAARAELESLRGDIRMRDMNYQSMTETANHFDRQLAAARADVKRLEQERNDADEYIRSLWRNDLLPRPMGSRLFDRLTNTPPVAPRGDGEKIK